jgi:hypothetical protein
VRWLKGVPPNRGPSLRKVSAELAARGYVTKSGTPYSASAVCCVRRVKLVLWLLGGGLVMRERALLNSNEIGS